MHCICVNMELAEYPMYVSSSASLRLLSCFVVLIIFVVYISSSASVGF
jgi:hypothetical protein